jgi:hypothetical protein
MYLEKQCCNSYYAEQLKGLGVAQKSLFYHTHSEKWGIMPKRSIDFTGDPTSAFTCAELVQMNENVYGISFSDREKKFYSGSAVDNDVFYYDTFSDALAAKLINAIKKEWITIDEVNARLVA